MSKILQGKIIVNPFRVPGQNIKQAERLVQEFNGLGVDCQIVYDSYLMASMVDGKINLDLDGVDFVIFLDKDKYLANMIDSLGVKMFNRAKQISDCDDKGQTCIALSNAGIKMPKTLFAPVCYSKDIPLLEAFIERVEREIGYPIIVKNAYGSMGNGVFKADNHNQLVSLMEHLKTSPHIYQQYLGKNFGTDVRIVLLGGKAIACMKRINPSDFRSNVGQGGKGVKIELDDPEYADYIALAEKVASHLGMDYCGVDLLTGDDNLPVVCEVNSNAFFEELEKISSVNVACEYAKYVVKTIKNLV